ncbi:MAG: hypothetical protein FWE80_03620, partial [Oscillospiraceae bacterium]|nr:hypothetical protein [Oscillospiraceae bacterium]
MSYIRKMQPKSKKLLALISASVMLLSMLTVFMVFSAAADNTVNLNFKMLVNGDQLGVFPPGTTPGTLWDKNVCDDAPYLSFNDKWLEVLWPEMPEGFVAGNYDCTWSMDTLTDRTDTWMVFNMKNQDGTRYVPFGTYYGGGAGAVPTLGGTTWGAGRVDHVDGGGTGAAYTPTSNGDMRLRNLQATDSGAPNMLVANADANTLIADPETAPWVTKSIPFPGLYIDDHTGESNGQRSFFKFGTGGGDYVYMAGMRISFTDDAGITYNINWGSFTKEEEGPVYRENVLANWLPLMSPNPVTLNTTTGGLNVFDWKNVTPVDLTSPAIDVDNLYWEIDFSFTIAGIANDAAYKADPSLMVQYRIGMRGLNSAPEKRFSFDLTNSAQEAKFNYGRINKISIPMKDMLGWAGGSSNPTVKPAMTINGVGVSNFNMNTNGGADPMTWNSIQGAKIELMTSNGVSYPQGTRDITITMEAFRIVEYVEDTGEPVAVPMSISGWNTGTVDGVPVRQTNRGGGNWPTLDIANNFDVIPQGSKYITCDVEYMLTEATPLRDSEGMCFSYRKSTSDTGDTDPRKNSAGYERQVWRTDTWDIREAYYGASNLKLKDTDAPTGIAVRYIRVYNSLDPSFYLEWGTPSDPDLFPAPVALADPDGMKNGEITVNNKSDVDIGFSDDNVYRMKYTGNNAWINLRFAQSMNIPANTKVEAKVRVWFRTSGFTGDSLNYEVWAKMMDEGNNPVSWTNDAGDRDVPVQWYTKSAGDGSDWRVGEYTFENLAVNAPGDGDYGFALHAGGCPNGLEIRGMEVTINGFTALWNGTKLPAPPKYHNGEVTLGWAPDQGRIITDGANTYIHMTEWNGVDIKFSESMGIPQDTVLDDIQIEVQYNYCNEWNGNGYIRLKDATDGDNEAKLYEKNNPAWLQGDRSLGWRTGNLINAADGRTTALVNHNGKDFSLDGNIEYWICYVKVTVGDNIAEWGKPYAPNVGSNLLLYNVTSRNTNPSEGDYVKRWSNKTLDGVPVVRTFANQGAWETLRILNNFEIFEKNSTNFNVDVEFMKVDNTATNTNGALCFTYQKTGSTGDSDPEFKFNANGAVAGEWVTNTWVVTDADYAYRECLAFKDQGDLTGIAIRYIRLYNPDDTTSYLEWGSTSEEGLFPDLSGPDMTGPFDANFWGDKVFTLEKGQPGVEEWDGKTTPDGFKADVFMKYDAANFYLGLKVTDPAFVFAPNNAGDIWEGCGIQILLADAKNNDKKQEFGFALSEQGKKANCWSNGAVNALLTNYNVEKVGDEYIYTIAIPLAAFNGPALTAFAEGNELFFQLTYNFGPGLKSGIQYCNFHAKDLAKDAATLALIADGKVTSTPPAPPPPPWQNGKIEVVPMYLADVTDGVFTMSQKDLLIFDKFNFASSMNIPAETVLKNLKVEWQYKVDESKYAPDDNFVNACYVKGPSYNGSENNSQNGLMKEEYKSPIADRSDDDWKMTTIFERANYKLSDAASMANADKSWDWNIFLHPALMIHYIKVTVTDDAGATFTADWGEFYVDQDKNVVSYIDFSKMTGIPTQNGSMTFNHSGGDKGKDKVIAPDHTYAYSLFEQNNGFGFRPAANTFEPDDVVTVAITYYADSNVCKGNTRMWIQYDETKVEFRYDGTADRIGLEQDEWATYTFEIPGSVANNKEFFVRMHNHNDNADTGGDYILIRSFVLSLQPFSVTPDIAPDIPQNGQVTVNTTNIKKVHDKYLDALKIDAGSSLRFSYGNSMNLSNIAYTTKVTFEYKVPAAANVSWALNDAKQGNAGTDDFPAVANPPAWMATKDGTWQTGSVTLNNLYNDPAKGYLDISFGGAGYTFYIGKITVEITYEGETYTASWQAASAGATNTLYDGAVTTSNADPGSMTTPVTHLDVPAIGIINGGNRWMNFYFGQSMGAAEKQIVDAKIEIVYACASDRTIGEIWGYPQNPTDSSVEVLASSSWKRATIYNGLLAVNNGSDKDFGFVWNNGDAVYIAYILVTVGEFKAEWGTNPMPIETTAPTSETTAPTSETTEPTSETTEPTSETTEPTSETTEPTSETTEPTSQPTSQPTSGPTTDETTTTGPDETEATTTTTRAPLTETDLKELAATQVTTAGKATALILAYEDALDEVNYILALIEAGEDVSQYRIDAAYAILEAAIAALNNAPILPNFSLSDAVPGSGLSPAEDIVLLIAANEFAKDQKLPALQLYGRITVDGEFTVSSDILLVMFKDDEGKFVLLDGDIKNPPDYCDTVFVFIAKA